VRISGGDARGIRLRVPPGARPASERVRQAVFSSLAAHVVDASVLDLYCGSGAYGLEALSRGARHATFVDRDPAALQAARENAKAAGLEQHATFVRSEALGYLLKRARRRDPVDVAFVDPPYADADATRTVLDGLGKAVRRGGRVVIESRWGPGEPPEPRGYVLEADRRYGDTRVLVYSREEPLR